MARPKPAEDREEVTVTLRVLPYFAAVCEQLPGIRGVGETPEDALSSIRSEVRRRFPFHKFDLTEVVE